MFTESQFLQELTFYGAFINLCSLLLIVILIGVPGIAFSLLNTVLGLNEELSNLSLVPLRIFAFGTGITGEHFYYSIDIPVWYGVKGGNNKSNGDVGIASTFLIITIQKMTIPISIKTGVYYCIHHRIFLISSWIAGNRSWNTDFTKKDIIADTLWCPQDSSHAGRSLQFLHQLKVC